MCIYVYIQVMPGRLGRVGPRPEVWGAGLFLTAPFSGSIFLTFFDSLLVARGLHFWTFFWFFSATSIFYDFWQLLGSVLGSISIAKVSVLLRTSTKITKTAKTNRNICVWSSFWLPFSKVFCLIFVSLAIVFLVLIFVWFLDGFWTIFGRSRGPQRAFLDANNLVDRPKILQ